VVCGVAVSRGIQVYAFWYQSFQAFGVTWEPMYRLLTCVTLKKWRVIQAKNKADGAVGFTVTISLRKRMA
jgi:hypothetical protein